ncbi:MAG: methyl-accepting chemotaxis protein [Desulfobacteraceae bacterium]|nr:methyl-accepting chemotaxis protein [Desulfobacteraceae bacterium]
MKLTLKQKLIIPTVIMILIGMGTLSVVSFIQSKNALQNSIIGQLENRTDATAAMLASWMAERRLNVESWTREKTFPGAVDSSWVDAYTRKKASNRLVDLKKAYIMYEDICLADSSGNVVSSSNPELVNNFNIGKKDFFTRAFAGQLYVTSLFKSPKTGLPVFVIAAPIHMADKVYGIIFVYTDFSVFSKDFIDPVKIGQSGYAYVLNDAGIAVTYPVKPEIFTLDISKTPAWKTMISAPDGLIESVINHRDILSAYKRIPEPRAIISITAMKDEILRPVAILGKTSLISTLLISLVAAAIIYLITRSLTGSVNQVVEGLKDAVQGQGDLTKRIQVRSKDEIGELARWFNEFVQAIQAVVVDVSTNATQLNNASDNLNQISQIMARGAELTSEKAHKAACAGEEMSIDMVSVAAAMEEASTNLNMVASASEEMSATINEIAGNTQTARIITGEAVQQIGQTLVKVNALGISAKKIGGVVESITDISEQVNLLALNATIEAARAGEAGRGFAVVANEIKVLASQTADAADQITDRVGSIQNDTQDTIVEITGISKVADNVNEIVSTIAAAVEQQSITTNEITNNVSQATQGIFEVNENICRTSDRTKDISNVISQVTLASKEMTQNSTQVNQSAKTLFDLAEVLSRLVGKFKTG